jgi:hypothetical protein
VVPTNSYVTLVHIVVPFNNLYHLKQACPTFENKMWMIFWVVLQPGNMLTERKPRVRDVLVTKPTFYKCKSEVPMSQ